MVDVDRGRSERREERQAEAEGRREGLTLVMAVIRPRREGSGICSRKGEGETEGWEGWGGKGKRGREKSVEPFQHRKMTGR